MIPFRDDNPTRRFPLVVVAFIAANIAVHIYRWALPPEQNLLFPFTYGAIPSVLLGQETLASAVERVLSAHPRFFPFEVRRALHDGTLPLNSLQPIWLSVFTSMFLHGDLLHLGGNMLYLWIFGNNVEDTLGHLRFTLFYLLCGCLAAAAQVLMSPGSPVPMVGASGAIAGVLGAYYVKFPYARIHCLVFLFFFVTVVALPAALVLLLWFLLQVYHSLHAGVSQGGGGIAFFAHIGGFLAGYFLIRRFAPRRRPQPQWWP